MKPRPRPDATARPQRVLHVFGSMNRGGAETRTLEIMRRLDGGHCFDFCVLSGTLGSYTEEITVLGGQVLPCPLRPHWYTFPLRFLRLLRRGRYDVVHSHVHHFSGVILALAAIAGVGTRVAHIRSTHDGRPRNRTRRLYRALARRLVDCGATAVVGVSESALAAFWGERWHTGARRQVIYNGVEAIPPGSPENRAGVRAEFGIDHNARVLIHVGSFTPAKNHQALLAVARTLMARGVDAVFLLVGAGKLRDAIESEVAASGLAHRFRFAGERGDVGRLLRAADLFVFPSAWEGLPGAVLEALAAGLPVLASPIPPVVEIARHAPGVTTCDPARPELFAREIERLLGIRAARATTPTMPLPEVFRVETAMRRLLECYR